MNELDSEYGNFSQAMAAQAAQIKAAQVSFTHSFISYLKSELFFH